MKTDDTVVTLEEVPLRDIRQHPSNLRRELGDVSELVASIKEFGILEPVVLAPASDGDGLVLIAGHRRHAAAPEAGLKRLPAVVRRDLDTDAKQVMAMLVENGRRRDLSPMEEADGYQLLLGLNLKAPAIAKAIGIPPTRVKSRLKLAELPEKIQGGIHTGQITLRQAETMAEFAGDAEALKTLVREAGGSNFDYYANQYRQRRMKATRLAAQRKDLEKAGVKIIQRPDAYPWDSKERPANGFWNPDAPEVEGQPRVMFNEETHRACPHHAVVLDTYNEEPEAVCLDPEAAGHQPLRRRMGQPASPEEAAAMAESRKQEQERREQLEVAQTTRRQFVAELAVKGDKAEEIIRVSIGEQIHGLLEEGDDDMAAAIGEVLGAKLPSEEQLEEANDGGFELYLFAFETALENVRSLSRLVGVLYGVSALVIDRNSTREFRWQDARFRKYIDRLVSFGYSPSPIEEELYERFSPDRRAEPTPEPDDSDDELADDELGEDARELDPEEEAALAEV